MQSHVPAAAAAGAFIGLAHPRWYGLTVEDALSIPEAHAVEIYNHGCPVESGRATAGWCTTRRWPRPGLGAYAADDAHFGTPDAGAVWVDGQAERWSRSRARGAETGRLLFAARAPRSTTSR